MSEMYKNIEAGHKLEQLRCLADLAGEQDIKALVADLNAQNDALLQEVRRLEVLCDHDAALQILNRRGLTRTLQGEISRVERHGVVSSFIYLDLDGFKPINDRYGHGQGDHILKKLADHIKARLRQSDHFARLGGDEFAIILAYATPLQAREKIEQLSSSVAKASRTWGPGAQNLAFSAGVSEISPGLGLDEIIKRADENMYLDKAKKAQNTKTDSL